MKSEIKTAIILGIGISVVVIGLSVGLFILEQDINSTMLSDKNNELSNTTYADANDILLSNEANTGSDTGKETSIRKLDIDKSRYKIAPNLVGIADYINTTPEKLEKEMQDKVVLYDIWTYSCINCIRTLPYITAWDTKYAEQGLLIIGIHSPEFEFEKDLDNVKMAVQKYNIEYPVVLDNDFETWKAFENRYWPRKYIADHEGYIRYDHIGEGAYDETEKIIQQLLKERLQALGLEKAHAESSLVDIKEFEHSIFKTPELYFGYKFAYGRNQLGNEEGFQPGKVVSYSIPHEIKPNYFYMNGDWQNLEDGMKLISDSGDILLAYNGKQVNIVAGTGEKEKSTADIKLEILLDGEPITLEYAGEHVTKKDDGTSIIQITDHDLYNVINSNTEESHILRIRVLDPGFEIFTFTFG